MEISVSVRGLCNNMETFVSVMRLCNNMKCSSKMVVRRYGDALFSAGSACRPNEEVDSADGDSEQSELSTEGVALVGHNGKGLKPTREVVQISLQPGMKGDTWCCDG